MGRGFTLIELVVVMVIVAVLAAVLTPMVTGYIDESRSAAAQADTRSIGEAIIRFEKDVGRYPMYSTITNKTVLPDSLADVQRLVGTGLVPASSLGSSNWSETLTDSGCTAQGCQADGLSDQLMSNAPAYTSAAGGSPAKQFRWKGPYIDVTSDPWGDAYLVNIINCKPSSPDACFVLSAGPNGKVDTNFDLPKSSAVTPSGDDIIFRIK